MYIPRILAEPFRKALSLFPAVLVTGPRQSGKTTFLLEEFSDQFEYASFDDPLERSFALSDPNGFLDRFKEHPVILDEIQYAPEILPYLKIRIDRERQKRGHWILTGSQQFQLMRRITESLAGRIAILELLPFSFLEIRKYFPDRSLEMTLWLGGYPEVVVYPEKRDLWMRSYIQTYIERDVRQLQNVRDLHLFEQFLALCAANHAQEHRHTHLSRELGVSVPTIKSWISVLEASYIVYLLPPYFKNFGKRVVKTPKLYFLDSGLVATLTRQPGPEAALSGAMGGALFEGWIISETIKAFSNKGLRPDIYFWRSHDGLEVDLLIRAQGKLYPVEIKLTATPTMKHITPLERFKKLALEESAETGILVCRVGEKTPLPRGNVALPWQEFPSWLSDLLEIERNLAERVTGKNLPGK